MKLANHEAIVGAWCEAYPRYGTELIWVCIRDARDGSHRVEALQAEDHPPELGALFPVAVLVSGQVIGAVQRQAATRKKGRGDR